MKNFLSRMFGSMLQWFRSARRIQKEQPFSPAEFQKMLAQTLADPDFKLMLLKSMSGTMWPIVGAACSSTQDMVAKFTDSSCSVGNSSIKDHASGTAVTIDSSGNVGIGTASPATVLQVGDPTDSHHNYLTIDSKANFQSALQFSSAGSEKWILYRPGLSSDLRLWDTTDRVTFQAGGNVGIGTTDRLSRLTVKGSASFPATGTVSVTSGSATVTGTSTFFTTDVGLGDKIRVTVSGVTYTRTVTFITDNTYLTVDPAFPASGSGLTMTVLPGVLRSEDVNQVVFLRPGGGSDPDDDGAMINYAIAALSDLGGIIMLTPGTYNIGTTISITKSGVKLRGYGGGNQLYVFNDPALTTLKWLGSGGTVLEVVSPNQAGSDAVSIGNIELSQLYVDGQSSAETGILINFVSSSRFTDLKVRFAEVGIKLTTGSDQPDFDSLFNLFENITTRDVSQGLVLDGTITTHGDDPSTIADTSQNTFVNLSIGYNGTNESDAGILVNLADANIFIRTSIVRTSGTSGNGVVIMGPDTCQANYFFHLGTGGGLLMKNADHPVHVEGKNTIYGYQITSDSSTPATDPSSVPTESVMAWIMLNGEIHGFQVLQRNSPTLFDDFLGKSLTSALGWVFNGGGGSSGLQPVNLSPVPQHPGLLQVQAGNGSWGYTILGPGDSGGNTLNPNQITFTLCAAVVRSNNGGIIRFGLFDDRGVASGGDNSVYFEAAYTGSTPNWTCNTRAGGGSISSTDSGIASNNVDHGGGPTFDSNFNLLEIVFNASSTVVFKIDGMVVATKTAPDSYMTVAFFAEGNASGPGQIWVDYFESDLTLNR